MWEAEAIKRAEHCVSLSWTQPGAGENGSFGLLLPAMDVEMIKYFALTGRDFTFLLMHTLNTNVEWILQSLLRKAFRAVTWLLPKLSVRRSALCMHGMAWHGNHGLLELQGPSHCPYAKAHSCPGWQLSWWQDTRPAIQLSLFSQQHWPIILSGGRGGPDLWVAPTTKRRACRARWTGAKCSSGDGMLGTSPHLSNELQEPQEIIIHSFHVVRRGV